MLGAAVVAGAAGVGATTAQAAEFGFHMRGPAAYIPPCPGPGYVWIAGYSNNGYWVPGYWNNVGYGIRAGGPGLRFEYGRSRGWDGDRGQERHFEGDRGPGHFRR
jgi:hypothetical protein